MMAVMHQRLQDIKDAEGIKLIVDVDGDYGEVLALSETFPQATILTFQNIPRFNTFMSQPATKILPSYLAMLDDYVEKGSLSKDLIDMLVLVGDVDLSAVGPLLAHVRYVVLEIENTAGLLDTKIDNFQQVFKGIYLATPPPTENLIRFEDVTLPPTPPGPETPDSVYGPLVEVSGLPDPNITEPCLMPEPSPTPHIPHAEPRRESKHLWDLVAQAYYINLDARVDRKNALLLEFEKKSQGFPMERLLRVPGQMFTSTDPSVPVTSLRAMGCLMSHVKCLQSAKDYFLDHPEEEGHFLVLEDDFAFNTPILDPLLNDVFAYLSTRNWEMFLLTANINEWRLREAPIVRCIDAQTTGGYLVHRDYVPTLLRNYEDGIKAFLDNPQHREQWAIDIRWKTLQPAGRWFSSDPPIGYQRADHSDIEGTWVDYSQSLLCRILHTATLKDHRYLSGLPLVTVELAGRLGNQVRKVPVGKVTLTLQQAFRNR